MIGEFLALCSAALYGVASVTIVQAKKHAVADNGVFLSVVVTFVMTLVLWVFWGSVGLAQITEASHRQGIFLFALAGICSTVLGRTAMYRATERIGAVKASLFRRLIPVFALPAAVLLVGEWPGMNALLGGAIIVAGTLAYQLVSRHQTCPQDRIGDVIGIASALFYALAYCFRRMGLEDVSDPLLGTMVGALVGIVFVVLSSVMAGQGLGHLMRDRSPWHWATAMALGLGQTLQFFALQFSPVSTVAVLGALDVFFAAALMALLPTKEVFHAKTLVFAGGLAVLGSAILFN